MLRCALDGLSQMMQNLAGLKKQQLYVTLARDSGTLLVICSNDGYPVKLWLCILVFVIKKSGIHTLC